MAKYKIHVNGNNQIASNQQPVNAVVQQIAQNTAAQQLQQPQASEQDNMRITVNDLIKNSLINPVEIPRYTTIKDVLNAPKGEKLSSFVDFLGTPESMRTIGNFLPKYGYNPKTGQLGNVMEESARRQETQFEADRQKALEQLKLQNALAGNVYDAYNRMDIADKQDQLRRDLAKEELEWRKQENALDRALKRDSLNAQIAHQRAMESIARDRMNGTATGGASGLSEKQLQKNIESLNSLNAVQSQMDRFSNSFDKVRPTKAGALLANTYASKGFGNGAESNFNAQRTLLFNKIARELGGEKGVLSDQDIKRIESSLPSLSDSLPQKRAKMKAVYDLLEDRKSQYGGGTASNNDPMGLGL